MTVNENLGVGLGIGLIAGMASYWASIRPTERERAHALAMHDAACFYFGRALAAFHEGDFRHMKLWNLEAELACDVAIGVLGDPVDGYCLVHTSAFPRRGSPSETETHVFSTRKTRPDM